MSHESMSRTKRGALVVVLIVVVAVVWDHVVTPRLGYATGVLVALAFAVLAFGASWIRDRRRRDGE